MRSFLAGIAFFLLIGRGRAADSPLEPLSWLTGGTWISELKPPKGDPITIRMVVNWTPSKQAIEYTIFFKNKDAEFAQYDGVYYWHPAAKEIRLLQTDRNGGVTEAVITVADGKWTQKNVHTNKDGVKSNQKGELTRDGDDAFRFRAFVPKGDDWIQALDATYKRVKEAKPAK